MRERRRRVGAKPCLRIQRWIVRSEGRSVPQLIRLSSTRMRPAPQRGCSRRNSRADSSSGGATRECRPQAWYRGSIAAANWSASVRGTRLIRSRTVLKGRSSCREMSEALAPSRVMRAKANLMWGSVARAIEVDSQDQSENPPGRTIPGATPCTELGVGTPHGTFCRVTEPRPPRVAHGPRRDAIANALLRLPPRP